MRKVLILLLILLLVPAAGCSGGAQTPEAPEQGVRFAIQAEGSPAHDAYEIQLQEPESSSFYVVTLTKEDGYQVTWAQSLVDEEQGNSYEMTAYQSFGDAGPDLDRPLSGTRTLSFKGGSTSEGRLVLVQVEE